MNTADFDIAILGSGFAGSLTALIARRLGRSVILLERGRHPRFAIGESSTPLANLLLENLSACYDLPRVRPLAKWGTWQRTYPEIACGLKRGFSFFHHQQARPFRHHSERRNQLLVAASPNNEIADTHWYRPDFDHFLMREAESAGAEYVDQFTLQEARVGIDSVGLRGERLGQTISTRAKFVIDATGPRGALHRALNLPEAAFDFLPPTQALFSHFHGVRRFQDTLGMSAEKELPYPLDDAALHHVFDGGWIWVLRFNNGMTSAGVAATERLANELKLADGRPGWDRLLGRYPSVGEQFMDAETTLPFVHMPNLSFRSTKVAGPNWVLLPSAAGFVDPLLSTGFTLTLLGISRIAEAIEQRWDDAGFTEHLQSYAENTLTELLTAERLIATLYSQMPEFDAFVSFALLYFAPVSFVEIARRIGASSRSNSFLLHDDPDFGPAARRFCESALGGVRSGSAPSPGKGELRQSILKAIDPIDVIGLSDHSRRNWYPALNSDLLRAASKLGVSEQVMRDFLNR